MVCVSNRGNKDTHNEPGLTCKCLGLDATFHVYLGATKKLFDGINWATRI